MRSEKKCDEKKNASEESRPCTRVPRSEASEVKKKGGKKKRTNKWTKIQNHSATHELSAQLHLDQKKKNSLVPFEHVLDSTSNDSSRVGQNRPMNHCNERDVFDPRIQIHDRECGDTKHKNADLIAFSHFLGDKSSSSSKESLATQRRQLGVFSSSFSSAKGKYRMKKNMNHFNQLFVRCEGAQHWSYMR